MLRAGPEPWGLPPGTVSCADRPGSGRVSCLLREVRRQITAPHRGRWLFLWACSGGVTIPGGVEGLRQLSDDRQAFEGQAPVCVAVTFDKSVTLRDLLERWLQSCFLD